MPLSTWHLKLFCKFLNKKYTDYIRKCSIETFGVSFNFFKEMKNIFLETHTSRAFVGSICLSASSNHRTYWFTHLSALDLITKVGGLSQTLIFGVKVGTVLKLEVWRISL